MAASDPNRRQLARVAEALGDLRHDVVFVGGATVGLLITDPAAPRVRPTKDVDVIVEVATYSEYQARVAPRLKASVAPSRRRCPLLRRVTAWRARGC